MREQTFAAPGDVSGEALLAQLRAELQAERMQRQALAQELAAVRAGADDFAGAVSHDLRANLRHIVAYAGLVREELGEAPKPELLSYLETVTRSAQRMGLQMSGLLALSQIGRVPLDLAALDVRALIEEARQGLPVELAGQQTAWHVADDFPLVQGDAALLRQLWSHLLSNALKFTALRAPARVELGWETLPDASLCALFVRDNGAGFNPRLKDRLFRPFQRLHGAGPFDGLGLGLAQAKKIVQRHGGSIEAESDGESGCLVRFTLPRAPAGGVAAP
jgi:signal transduction histidine kinase